MTLDPFKNAGEMCCGETTQEERKSKIYTDTFLYIEGI